MKTIEAAVWLTVNTGERIWSGSVPIHVPLSNIEAAHDDAKYSLLREQINRDCERIAANIGLIVNIGIQAVNLFHEDGTYQNLDTEYVEWLTKETAA